MRILITGASGFIGGRLFYSAPSGCEVWGTYFDTPNPVDSARLLPVDLRNQVVIETVLQGIKPDIVIHCAAYSRVSFCEREPSAAWVMNTRAVMGLAVLCGQRGIRLVFLSSDMVFDGEKGSYRESDRPNPINFYGRTKQAAERRIKDFIRSAAIIRVNLVYGKPMAGGSSFSEEVIREVQSGRPYQLFADQSRSFISVQNLSQCIWEIALSDYSGLIHLGGSEPANRVTFAEKLAAQVGLDRQLLIPKTAEELSPEISYPKNNTFNISLAQKTLKTPLLNLTDGLKLEYPG